MKTNDKQTIKLTLSGYNRKRKCPQCGEESCCCIPEGGTATWRVRWE